VTVVWIVALLVQPVGRPLCARLIVGESSSWSIMIACPMYTAAPNVP
jgi:hypothetical protein